MGVFVVDWRGHTDHPVNILFVVDGNAVVAYLPEVLEECGPAGDRVASHFGETMLGDDLINLGFREAGQQAFPQSR